MSTWGPSKKRTNAKKSGSGSSRAGSTTGPTKGSKGSKGVPAPAKPRAAGTVRDATPPEGDVAASGSLRTAVGGREHEFVGIALIGVGVLLGLAVYVDRAGPFGLLRAAK